MERILHNPEIFKRGIARKFIICILLFSSVITLCLTLIQLYMDYSNDIEDISKNMKQIETTHLQGIASNLWISDTELLKIQLKGIMKLPDMQYLEIREQGERVTSVGDRQETRIISHSYPLSYFYNSREYELGTLEVVASLEGVYNRLVKKGIVILISQSVKTFLVSSFIFFLFYHLVGRHLNRMATYACTLHPERLDTPLSLNRPVSNNNDDELTLLVSSINKMRVNLSGALGELQKMNEGLEKRVAERTAELSISNHDLEIANQKIKKAMDSLWGEMELAKKIQMVLLPKKPEIRGYEIAASMEPSEEVGGDYYDVISIGGYDWIVIGDVSGHGVNAGLVMMMVQTAIHTVLIENPEVSPSYLLSVINKSIYSNIELMEESKHMTIVVLASGKDGYFTFSGLHEDILICRAGTGEVDKIESDGMWIGLEPDISEFLSDDTQQMEPGDCMVLFTDGITEAYCEKGKLFGDERLIELVEKSGSRSASQIRESIIHELDACETPDDVTLVVIKRM